MKEISALKMLDVWFPSSMLEQYDGPSYTIDDMRKYLNVYDRPILGTIVKPKIGLTAAEYAEVCYEFWSGGGDFVKMMNLKLIKIFVIMQKWLNS
jgi:ribulose-bisphosphate carboxylase large chain